MYAALCLAVLAVTSMWYLWNQTVARSRLLDLGRAYALAGTEDIAARAVVPTLVGEAIPDIVDRLATAHVGRGDILALQLSDAHQVVLGEYGDRRGALASCRATLPLGGTQLQSAAILLPHAGAWCLSVPVRQVQPTAECPSGGCATGRLWVVQSTRPVDAVLKQMRGSLLRSAALVVGLGLLLSFWLARRLTRPLLLLEGTMRAASAGDRAIKAPVTRGPLELRTMGAVFNDMQERAARYEDTLKDQVRERTHQLELARAQAVDAARYKSEFMAHVSHNMRMPLVVIKDLAQVALRELAFGTDPSGTEENLRRIARRCEALMSQVELVIQFMRSEHSEAPAGPVRSTDLRDYFLARRRDLELLAQRNGNQLVSHADHGAVFLEEDSMSTILENLIDNAAKFTSNGTIRVDLRLEEDWIVVKVSDSGCGISPDALPFVWDDFRRATSSTASAAAGFGLGLAIVRRLVDRNAGQRQICSTLGAGTEVTIRLPRRGPSVQAAGQGRIAEQGEMQSIDAPMSHDRALQSSRQVVDQGIADSGDGRETHIKPPPR
jgi:signal transduction histidine kinase